MTPWLRPVGERERVAVVRVALAMISLGIAVPTLVIPERGSPILARDDAELAVVAVASPIPLASATPVAVADTSVAASAATVAAAGPPTVGTSTTETVGAAAPETVGAPAGETVGAITHAAPVSESDLAHETYTATGALSASLVSPSDGEAASGPAAKIVAATVLGGGVELAVNGEVVSHARIGEKTVDKKNAQTRYAFYGVPLHPGPNAISLTPLGLDGLRGTPATATVYGPGRPLQLKAHVDGQLVADGKTPGFLVISALDEWHHPAAQGAGVKISIVSGDARFEAAHSAPATPLQGTQSATDATATRASTEGKLVREAVLQSGGTVRIPIFPGVNAGQVELEVQSGDLDERVGAYVAPYLRKPLVNGLVSVGTGVVPGLHGQTASTFDANDGRRGRVAIFGTGTLHHSTNATIAYDSGNDLMQHATNGAFVDNPNERPYLTYGDASTRRDDTLSQDHLYARIDNGKRSLTYGQIQADTMGANAVGGYRELVHGTKLELSGAAAHLSLFSAHTDVAYARFTMNPSGLSSASQLLSPDIVVGSETLTLVALDRRTGVPIGQEPLQRNVDYTLDYQTGTLRFINIPLPFDDAFNPQAVLVQYQYKGVHARASKLGGRFDGTFGPGKSLRFGAGYVNANSGVGNFSLLEEDIAGVLPFGQWSLSRAQSFGVAQVPNDVNAALGSSGVALRGKLSMRFAGTHFEGLYERTSAGYANSYGGLTTPGLLNYHAQLTRGTPRTGEIAFTVDGQSNQPATGGSSTQFSTGLSLRRSFSNRLTMSARIDSRHESTSADYGTQSRTVLPAIGSLGLTNPNDTAPRAGSTTTVSAASTTTASSATQAQFALDYKVSQRLALNVNRTSNFGGGSIASAPAQTQAQIAYDFGGKGKIFARELWSAAAPQAFASATSSLTSSTSATSSFALGVERAIGSSTNIDTQYVVDKTGSGQDVYTSIGVKERFAFSKRLRGDFSLQRANASGTSGTTSLASGNGIGGTGLASTTGGGFTVAALNLSYSGGDRLRITTALQTRSGSSGGTTLQVGVAGKLSSELSLIGVHNSSTNPNAVSIDDRVSVAWRPTENDHGATLFGYTHRAGVGQTPGSSTNVLSLEHDRRITRRLELFGRVAQKLDGDGFYAAHSTLVGLGVDQTIGSRVDLGVEERSMKIANVAGAQSTNVAIEGGYRLGEMVRLAVGFNAHTSADPNLTNAPIRRGFYATVTSVVDRIFGWGKPR